MALKAVDQEGALFDRTVEEAERRVWWYVDLQVTSVLGTAG